MHSTTEYLCGTGSADDPAHIRVTRLVELTSDPLFVTTWPSLVERARCWKTRVLNTLAGGKSDGVGLMDVSVELLSE